MIDSHAHLGDPAFADDRDEVITRSNLAHIIDICTDEETLNIGLELRKKYPNIHLAAATTPHDVEGDTFFPLVEANVDKLVAIGETGLDYYYEHSPRDLQKAMLIRHLELAKSHQKPVIIHCRDAFSDLFGILDDTYPYARGILHCFTGTLEEAFDVVKRNWLVSFSGIVTFKKSDALREVVRKIPLSHLVIETDAPYLAPQSRRGKRCEPAYVAEVAETIARVKDLPLDEVIRVTSQNVLTLIE